MRQFAISNYLILRRTCVLGLLALGACVPLEAPPLDAAPALEQVSINRSPTGSIQVQSLCERAAIDLRVTHGGADSFAVAWREDHYQVVYTDRATQALYSLQLDSLGKPRGPAVSLTAGPVLASIPSLVATPTGYVVAWQQDSAFGSEGSVEVQALDRAGAPIGPGRRVASGRSTQMRPVLSRSPNGVAIAWMDQSASDRESLTSVGDSSITIGLIDERMNLRADLPAQAVSPGSRAGYPWLAGDETQLALMWTNERDGRADTYFASLGSSLAPPVATALRDGQATNAALLGRLLLTDFGYLSAWEDLRSGEEEIYMAVLDPSGKAIKRGLVEEPSTGNANWPHMAWTGTTAAIVYYQFRGGRPQIFLTFLDAQGERIGGGADAQVSSTTNWARYPEVLWTGSEFGVLWIDARHGAPELYFNRTLCAKPAPL